MSNQLHSTFFITTEKSLNYWLPLFCNLFYAHNFQFENSSLLQQYGRYSYADQEGIELVEGSFKDMWNRAYKGSEIGVVFWFTPRDNLLQTFDVELFLDWNEQLTLLKVSFTIPGATFSLFTLEQARWCMLHLIKLWKGFDMICASARAEIYWSGSSGHYPAWASFGRPPNLANAQRSFYPSEAQLLVNTFEQEHTFFFLDPVAIPRERNVWDFTSIASSLEGSIVNVSEEPPF
jgi:hypothetical protein